MRGSGLKTRSLCFFTGQRQANLVLPKTFTASRLAFAPVVGYSFKSFAEQVMPAFLLLRFCFST